MRSRATAGATRAGWCDYLPSLATLWVSRDTLRSAALRWITPFWAARMISGAADFKAAIAAVLSPEAIASSTLRTEVRMSERRDLLISVRRAITRAALRAEEVLAIDGSSVGRAGQFGRPPSQVVKIQAAASCRRLGRLIVVPARCVNASGIRPFRAC